LTVPRCPLKGGGARDQAAAEEIGPNPTDRGKLGSKRHVLVDRQGTPLAIWLTPANVHDGQLLTALVDAVEPIESSERLGRYRWVVERTLAWLGRFRRLAIRYERRADIHLAFLDLGCALLCFATLQHVGCCQALSVGN
jgi:transposase